MNRNTEELAARLRSLKVERKALILAHNYQSLEVQDQADMVADSLGLSRRAAKAEADVILFCGVHFMAETAAVLAPGKRVIIPDPNSGCPMANMVTPRELIALKKQHPNALVLAYVNTSAAVKAEADICCTSANAVETLQSLPRDREIIFLPDKNLADYAARKAGRAVIPWPGYCPTHAYILADDILRLRAEHPQAKVVAHPECRRDVLDLADHVASTTGIGRYCAASNAREFIIATEIGMIHRMERDHPEKRFYPASVVAECPNMKLTTLEKMVWALEDMDHEVIVPPEIAARAARALQRMIEIG